MAAPSFPRQAEALPNQYVVVFKPHVTAEQRSMHRAWAAERHFSVLSTAGHGRATTGVLHKFNIGDGQCTGYAAHIPPEVMQEVNNTDEVDYVEPDYKVYPISIIQQKTPSWGLARISSKQKLTTASRDIYIYDDEAAGKGVNAYVIDTGVLAEHDDFEGRAKFGYNAVPGSQNTDLDGHGTHVSGTIGGKTYGIAKNVNIIGVKVLGDNGQGAISGVIAGVQWAVSDAQQKGINMCVANMSLGGPYSRALNQAVTTAVNQGLTIVVAAGNDGEDADVGSPSSVPSVVTVGAIDIEDKVAYFSNYGKRVDIFAPGVAIRSTYIDTTGGGATDSTYVADGTSMASPHVTGLAAYLKSKDNSLDTPGKAVARLKSLALKGQILSTTLKGSVNSLAYNGESTD